jgi:hypothetical protein
MKSGTCCTPTATRTNATCGERGVSFRAWAGSLASAGRAAAIALAAGAHFALAQPVLAPLAPAVAPDPALAARILALDPDRLSEHDVREVLARAPAPRIIALQGSLLFITMDPFGEFLVAMGYPRERIRNPRDGTYTWSSFGSSTALAGSLAWYYEREGMMPLLIGHSQGGMLAIRTLYELAGEFSDSTPVTDPHTGETLPRTTIVDPETGASRPVQGLKVPYAAALATGKLPRLLLGQWSMLTRLRYIPDTAVEFTGFSFRFDPIAGEYGGPEPYVAIGSAVVRNVTLPAAYSHLGLPNMLHLAVDASTRAWINAYIPDGAAAPLPPDADTTNIVQAADLWFSIKKHWCLAAQRWIRAQKVEPAP